MPRPLAGHFIFAAMSGLSRPWSCAARTRLDVVRAARPERGYCRIGNIFLPIPPVRAISLQNAGCRMSSPVLDRTRVVARLTGTLPEGGFEEGTPIHAVDLPDLLRREDAPVATRDEIDLGGKLAFVIENVLTREECGRLIAVTETLGFRDAAPGINTPPGMRRNKTVHWIAPAAVMDELFRRIAPLLPQELDGRRLTPALSHRINTYRYDRGDEFNLHIDGDWPGFGLSQDGQRMAQWSGTHSMLTMLLYMNGAEDGLQGGSTTLYDQGELRASVTPRTGRALFFRHGSNRDTVLHAGDRLLGNVPKYVARINVMYDL